MYAHRFELDCWKTPLLHQHRRRSDHHRRLQCADRFRYFDHAHALAIQIEETSETEITDYVHVHVGGIVS